MGRLVLRPHLAPLVGSSPFIDVVGSSDPRVVPDTWLEQTRQASRGPVERVTTAQAGETTVPNRPGNPTTVPYLWSAVTYLPAPGPGGDPDAVVGRLSG